jgi:hypothetical protein
MYILWEETKREMGIMNIMKNEDAVGVIVGVTLMVAIAVILAAIIALFVFSIVGGASIPVSKDMPKYTENITIKNTYKGNGMYIISTDNVEYETPIYQIYWWAEKHIGEQVNIVYIGGENKECLVIEIYNLPKVKKCTIDTCGTPV